MAYVALIAISVWGLVRAFTRPGSRWARYKPGLSLLVFAEAIYILRAPACVYLPRVPGEPPVRRSLIGADGGGRTYWLEVRGHTAFAWGPRWWFLLSRSVDGGIEFIPPLRFARFKGAAQEIVRSDGSRKRFPEGPRLWARDVWLIEPDGSLVSWGPTGIYRLAPDSDDWNAIAEWGWNEYLGALEAVCALPQERFLEIREVEEGARESRGRRRDLLFLERDGGGGERRRVPLSVTDESGGVPGEMGRTLRVASAPQGILLIQTWRNSLGGQGRVYVLSRDYEVQHPAGSFEFDFGDEEPDVAISAEGRFFTTGRAVFRTSGERVMDLVDPLTSGVWVGDTSFYGVRTYPFFAAEIETRSIPFNQLVPAARARLEAGRHLDPRLRDAAEARKKSGWVLAGYDESGREDDIVQVSVQ